MSRSAKLPRPPRPRGGWHAAQSALKPNIGMRDIHPRPLALLPASLAPLGFSGSPSLVITGPSVLPVRGKAREGREAQNPGLCCVFLLFLPLLFPLCPIPDRPANKKEPHGGAAGLTDTVLPGGLVCLVLPGTR